jgi:hypothetical protein
MWRSTESSGPSYWGVDPCAEARRRATARPIADAMAPTPTGTPITRIADVTVSAAPVVMSPGTTRYGMSRITNTRSANHERPGRARKLIHAAVKKTAASRVNGPTKSRQLPGSRSKTNVGPGVPRSELPQIVPSNSSVKTTPITAHTTLDTRTRPPSLVEFSR